MDIKSHLKLEKIVRRFLVRENLTDNLRQKIKKDMFMSKKATSYFKTLVQDIKTWILLKLN